MMKGQTSAAPVEWPGGARCAVAFTFDVDADCPPLAANPQLSERMGTISHQAYGPLVGVPRILGILDEFGVPGTFFVPGFTAHRYHDNVREIIARGHEIAHHGYLHEPLAGVDEETERGYLQRGIDALVEVTGVRPIGYRAPMWEVNWRTPRLLAEYGFLYDSSLMDSDHPYQLATAEGADTSIVELPVSWALDDWQQYCHIPDFYTPGLIESPDKAVAVWSAELDAMRAWGGLWILTNHPFLSGRPGRAAALRRFIRDVKAMDDVWVAGLTDIANHVQSQRLQPRTLTPPKIPTA